MLCTRPYRLFQSHPPLMYKLPVRNISLALDQKGQDGQRGVRYDGFDYDC